MVPESGGANMLLDGSKNCVKATPLDSFSTSVSSQLLTDFPPIQDLIARKKTVQKGSRRFVRKMRRHHVHPQEKRRTQLREELIRLGETELRWKAGSGSGEQSWEFAFKRVTNAHLKGKGVVQENRRCHNSGYRRRKNEIERQTETRRISVDICDGGCRLISRRAKIVDQTLIRCL